jgi:hypothetical protein
MVLMLFKFARKKITLLNVALIFGIDVFYFRFLRTRSILLFKIQKKIGLKTGDLFNEQIYTTTVYPNISRCCRRRNCRSIRVGRRSERGE